MGVRGRGQGVEVRGRGRVGALGGGGGGMRRTKGNPIGRPSRTIVARCLMAVGSALIKQMTAWKCGVVIIIKAKSR